MKKCRAILTLVLAMVAMACQNNGYIGSLFGTWSLSVMTVDGRIPADFRSGGILWSFQNNIIAINLDNEPHQPYTRYGTWIESDDRLDLDFSHYDDKNPPGMGPYLAPAELGFVRGGVTVLEFVEKSSRRMTLTQHDAEGRVWVYYLKKTF